MPFNPGSFAAASHACRSPIGRPTPCGRSGSISATALTLSESGDDCACAAGTPPIQYAAMNDRRRKRARLGQIMVGSPHVVRLSLSGGTVDVNLTGFAEA